MQLGERRRKSRAAVVGEREGDADGGTRRGAQRDERGLEACLQRARVADEVLARAAAGGRAAVERVGHGSHRGSFVWSRWK